jgi:hypothetical protein
MYPALPTWYVIVDIFYLLSCAFTAVMFICCGLVLAWFFKEASYWCTQLVHTCVPLDATLFWHPQLILVPQFLQVIFIGFIGFTYKFCTPFY